MPTAEWRRTIVFRGLATALGNYVNRTGFCAGLQHRTGSVALKLDAGNTMQSEKSATFGSRLPVVTAKEKTRY